MFCAWTKGESKRGGVNTNGMKHLISFKFLKYFFGPVKIMKQVLTKCQFVCMYLYLLYEVYLMSDCQGLGKKLKHVNACVFINCVLIGKMSV